MVMPYDDIRDHPSLRVSPLGVVPQRDRRPRIIVDYSFYHQDGARPEYAVWRSNRATHARPDKIKPKVRREPTIQSGHFRRLLSSPPCPIEHSQAGRRLAKLSRHATLDCFPASAANGMDRVPTILLRLHGDNMRFNERIAQKAPALSTTSLGGPRGGRRRTTECRLGTRQLSHAPDLSFTPKQTVYSTGIGQQSQQNPLRNQRRTLLHNIDRVFRPTDSLDASGRKDPISTSKLDKGDAAWQNNKRCLGWDFGGRSKTLAIPAHRREKARSTLQDMLNRKRPGLTDWQSLLGDLRSLVPGLPGSKGQFSLLQAALAPRDNQHRIRLGPTTKTQLRTFDQLLAQPDRPTYGDEMIPGEPSFIGACDAAKPGMGGVWFDNTTDQGAPLVWRTPFPPHLQRDLVSQSNPHGRITNSDLELAGTLAQQAVLQEQQPLYGQTTHTFCDNTPSVAWRTKGSTTTTKSTAYLLSWAALHQRQHGYQAKIQYLEGPKNQMADDASRLWHLNDTVRCSPILIFTIHRVPLGGFASCHRKRAQS
jgi:hypothetical protein